MVRVAMLLGVLYAFSYCEEPSDTAVTHLLSTLKERSYSSKWEFYPLNLFPYLRAQPHAWSLDCSDHYVSTSERHGVVCVAPDGVCYIGSKTFIDKDSLYLYRSEKYLYAYKKWSFLQEYIIVTNFYGDIQDAFTRETVDGPLQKIPIL